MSRIGKKPIALPKGVTVNVHADAVEVKGPKGALRQRLAHLALRALHLDRARVDVDLDPLGDRNYLFADS